MMNDTGFSSARSCAELLVIAVALILVGCSTTPPRYVPIAGPGMQEIRTNKETGRPYVLSAMDRSRVAIEHADFDHEGLTFNIKVITDQEGVPFGPSSIAVTQGDKKRTVLGRQDLSKSVNASYGKQKAAAAIGGAVAFLGAVVGTLAGETQAASNFMTHVQSSATDYQQAASDEQGLTNAVGKTHLDETSLVPGQLLTGMVTIEDASSDQPLEFQIAVGSDVHTIRFQNADAK